MKEHPSQSTQNSLSQTNNTSDNSVNNAKGLFADKAFAKDNNDDSHQNAPFFSQVNSVTDTDADSDRSSTSSNSNNSNSSEQENGDRLPADAQLSSTQLSSTQRSSDVSQDLSSSSPSLASSSFLSSSLLNLSSNSSPKQNLATLAIGEPLKLAVVGHTNTGKTSILRTLLRDKYFGEVKNEAATTRHVERAMISDSQTGDNLVALYDTPGLEDASGVMDWLEDNTASRRDGIERLQHFLASDVADSKHCGDGDHTGYDFSQEAKVIRQLLGSDMAIYVIDAREPVLGKYKDELTILSWSATPVMPVFNFTTAKNNYISDWRTMLARRGLHVNTHFDSVAFEFNDEISLWSNLATMLTNDEILTQLMSRRHENWQTLLDEGNLIIADFLLNVTSFVREVADDDDPLPTLNEMKEAVRQAERAMQKQLLDLYKFYDSEVASTPVELNEYQQDPFDSELLKNYGIRTTSGAAAGALLGMGIDAAALGTTLGLGTALGSLAGGLLSNTSKIADMITGKKHLHIDPATITLLATRAMELQGVLRHRGHATLGSTITSNDHSHQRVALPWSNSQLPNPLKKARHRPDWSSLGGANTEQAQLLRQDMAWTLSSKLNASSNVTEK